MTFTGEFTFLLGSAIAIICSAIGGVELANYLWGF